MPKPFFIVCLCVCMTMLHTAASNSEKWRPEQYHGMPLLRGSNPPYVKLSQTLLKCVHLLESNTKLQAFKPLCASYYMSHPAVRVNCFLFVHDIIRYVEDLQVEDVRNFHIVRLCLTLLAREPLSSANRGRGSTMVRGKRKGGRGGGGRSSSRGSSNWWRSSSRSYGGGGRYHGGGGGGGSYYGDGSDDEDGGSTAWKIFIILLGTIFVMAALHCFVQTCLKMDETNPDE